MLKFDEDAIVADFFAAHQNLLFYRKDLEDMLGLSDFDICSWQHLLDVTAIQSNHSLEDVITKLLDIKAWGAALTTLGKVLNVPQDVMSKLHSGEIPFYIPPGYDNPPF